MRVRLSARQSTVVALAGLLTITGGAAALAAQDPQKPPQPRTLTGKWVLSLELSMDTSTPTLELVQEGDKLKGTYAGRYGKFPLAGVLKGRAVQFTVVINADGQESEMGFTGEVAADGATMKGDAFLEGMGEATWSAKRAPTTAAGSRASPR
jgi:hypothetical protein